MKKFLCVIIALMMIFAGCVCATAEEGNENDTKITGEKYSVIQNKTCAISISGVTADMSATLSSQVSASLKITAELQKLKSGVYSTIKTYTETATGRTLMLEESRLINALSTYRLKVTFTAGSETVITYAYP